MLLITKSTFIFIIRNNLQHRFPSEPLANQPVGSFPWGWVVLIVFPMEREINCMGAARQALMINIIRGEGGVGVEEIFG
jgi:hypothetical protein